MTLDLPKVELSNLIEIGRSLESEQDAVNQEKLSMEYMRQGEYSSLLGG